jgi:hypothetical protein
MPRHLISVSGYVVGVMCGPVIGSRGLGLVFWARESVALL